MAVMCASCSVPNDWHFRYCFSCGGLIKAPLRCISNPELLHNIVKINYNSVGLKWNLLHQ